MDIQDYYEGFGGELRPKSWTDDFVQDVDFVDEPELEKMKSKLGHRLVREFPLYVNE